MDKITCYRQKVKQVLREFVDYISGSPSPSDRFTVFDDEQNCYTVFDLGWQNRHRIKSMPVLIRILNEKVWVEVDNTDYVFVDRLLEAGIPAGDIVLAFHPPDMRQYTDFAVA